MLKDGAIDVTLPMRMSKELNRPLREPHAQLIQSMRTAILEAYEERSREWAGGNSGGDVRFGYFINIADRRC